MMADASGCTGFNHSVASQQLESEMETPKEEQLSVLDSASIASTPTTTATATAPEQPPPPPSSSPSSSSSSADLEAKKQRLLEELESALLPDNTNDKSKQDSNKQDLAPAPPAASRGLGLGFEVIDETALVETFSLPPSAAAPPPSAKGGKNVKKQSSSRRKAKKDAFKHKTGNGNGSEKKTAAFSEEEALKNKNKMKNRKYSRKEMEALRFADVEKQRAFWNAIHAGLEPVVASEYDTLLAVTTLPLPAPLCQLPNKKHAAPPILSVGAANGRWRYMNVFVH